MKIFFHAWRISLNGRHQFVVSNSSRFQWNFPDLTIDSKNRKQAFNLILVKRQASNTMKQTRYFLGDSYFSNESTIHVWAWLILMAMSCVFVFKEKKKWQDRGNWKKEIDVEKNYVGKSTCDKEKEMNEKESSWVNNIFLSHYLVKRQKYINHVNFIKQKMLTKFLASQKWFPGS